MANGKKTPLTNRGLFGQMAIPEGNRDAVRGSHGQPNKRSQYKGEAVKRRLFAGTSCSRQTLMRRGAA